MTPVADLPEDVERDSIPSRRKAFKGQGETLGESTPIVPYIVVYRKIYSFVSHMVKSWYNVNYVGVLPLALQ